MDEVLVQKMIMLRNVSFVPLIHAHCKTNYLREEDYEHMMGYSDHIHFGKQHGQNTTLDVYCSKR